MQPEQHSAGSKREFPVEETNNIPFPDKFFRFQHIRSRSKIPEIGNVPARLDSWFLFFLVVGLVGRGVS